LLGANEFDQMKDGVVLVNVSRGSLIDEHALAASLDREKVALAALDVRHPEPPDPGNDPLRGRRNVIQTPHIAGASRDVRREVHDATAERVLDLLERAGLVPARRRGEDEADVRRVHHVDELEDLARSRLSDATYGYVAGGAGLERAVSRNRESLDAVRLVPRVMRDVREVTTATSLLGEDVAFPLVLAPSAVQRLAHPAGELATARAAKQAGLLMILSMNASTTMEDVAAEEVIFWQQLYVSADRGHMKGILQRADDAGARALCLTVDHAGMPTRIRELHHPLVIPPEVEFVHLAEDPTLRGIDRGLTWDAVEWIREVSDLPLVLKGVLHPEDIRIAAEVGVDAVVVSNHGGRQLDGTVSAYDVIGPILEANAERMEVLADGGIRSGTDLLKVLALGARAGLIGRPVWWGLASAGEAGVRRVIELVTDELVESMRLCGVSSVGEITGEILWGRP
jgi:4-hydroxymandelate oxidase